VAAQEKWFWPQSHTNVIEEILSMAKKARLFITFSVITTNFNGGFCPSK